MKNVNTKSVNVNGLILAIDLGKFKSVVCAYEGIAEAIDVDVIIAGPVHLGEAHR
jgi:hypothetical protein